MIYRSMGIAGFIGALALSLLTLPALAEIKIQEVTSPGGIKPSHSFSS